MVSVQNVVIIRKMFLCVTSVGWKWVSMTIRSMVAMKINKRDALSTALVALEDASRVKYNSMEYMVGYYNATIRQLLADLPVSHTIKFTEQLNRHTITFFGEEK